MRFLTLLLISLFLALTSGLSPAQAKDHPDQVLGAGIVLGNPSAISAKYWLDSKTAIDAALAFSLSDYVLIHSNYLMHFPGFFKTQNKYVNQFVPYLGFGAVVVVAQKDRSSGDGFVGKKSGSLGLGIRVPLGVEWLVQEVPLGVYLEAAPGLALTPSTSGFIQGGLGVRYYF